MHAAPRSSAALSLTLLAIALVVLAAAFPPRAFASLPSGSGEPRVVSPVEDATVPVSGLRFAWSPAPGATRHFLLWSRAPFDPQGWTGLRSAGAVQVRELAQPMAAPGDVGLGLDEDARIWWAAAGSDPSGARVTFSRVRSCFVLRRFANRIEQSPLLSVSPIGREELPAAHGAYRIRLRAGYDIDPALGEPVLPAALRASAVPANGTGAVLVYYGDADPEQVRLSILAGGGSVVAYIPDHTFLVRTAAPGSFSLKGAWVGAYQPAYKLGPELPSDPAVSLRATVLLFPDGDLVAVRAAAQAAGLVVERSSSNGINRLLRVTGAAGALTALAVNPDVAWIEPYVQPTMDNSQAQWVLQTSASNNRRVWDMGLKGEGQVVMTSDSGVNMGHNMFRDPLVPVTGFGSYPAHRKVIAYLQGTPDPAIEFGDHGVFHGTHTAGSVCGNDDALGASANDGMAKNAKLFFEDISGSTLGTSVEPPLDLNDLYQPSYDGNAGGAARLSSNSWGASNGGVYDTEAYQADQFMWNHPDYLLFFSNGNSGPTAATVGSPAVAKNVASVGGVVNGVSENSIYNSGSRGPAKDLRRKPTLCGVAQGVVSAYTGTTAEQNLSGTSMASPTATGTAALIRQYLTEGWYPTGTKIPANGFTPSAALMKALCINSGNNLTSFKAPDNNIGWGRMNADSVLYFSGDARRLLLVDNTTGLGNGQFVEYRVNVADGSIPLKVSLCWTDYPGNPAAVTQIVNDLDLTVSNGATTYLGSVFNTTFGVSATGGQRDSLNVEEGVRLSAPLAAGVWTVRVNARNVPAGPQPFALVITGGIGTTAGSLALDRAQYGSASTVQLRVTDTDAGGSTNVLVSSPTEPAGEMVTLTGANGILTGSLALSPVTGTTGDNVLQVSSGDVITATYNDASPVASLVATAQVDFYAPQVTGVRADNQGAGSVLVSWNTGTSSSSRVYYGTTAALGSSTTLDPLARLVHAVAIGGLTTGQTYFYDVESQDLNGNSTRDDNGGRHYRFTVDPTADLLLVYDGDGFEHAASYTTALAALGWSYDVWTGALSATPAVGDLVSGLRAYRAVWWQNGLEHYPPFSDAARTALTQYLDGGGRLAVNGHDLTWANQDPTSPYYTASRAAWVQSTLHAQFVADPAGWTSLAGIAGDPVSGAFAGGLPYAEHRSGASGDEVTSLAGAGTAVYDWLSPTPADCGIRWESSGPLGTAGTAVWAGQTSRLADNFFEWSDIDTAHAVSPTRVAVLDSTLRWLVGRGRPTVALLAPNGGEVFTGDTISIAWNEGAAAGTSIGARSVQYSLDGGQSWTTLSSSAAPSPYAWYIGDVPNSASARVRVRVSDDGAPSLSATDASDAAFAIARAGGDGLGPVVTAGSIHCTPNPVGNTQPAGVVALVSDAASGNSGVAAAEWSFGDVAAPQGTGHAMTGAFGPPSVSTSAALATGTFTPGQHRLWVRGRDSAGNWGSALGLPIVVNGSQPLAVTPGAVDFGLAPAAPNPVTRGAVITYSLPVASNVDLAVFDVGGRRVRTLVSGSVVPGVHHAGWDRSDDGGRRVRSGVYFYRLTTSGRTFVRRLVALD